MTFVFVTLLYGRHIGRVYPHIGIHPYGMIVFGLMSGVLAGCSKWAGMMTEFGTGINCRCRCRLGASVRS